jgi:hypothetical protein
MKKFICPYANVAILASTVALLLITICCSNYHDDVYVDRSQQFNKNLTAYFMNQKALLTKVSTRAGENHASIDEVMQIAQEIDENMQTFKDNNKDLLITLDNLTDDEMELIRLDPDYMLSYLDENFSSKTYKYAADFLHGDLQVDVSQVASDTELSPSEKTFVSNLIIASEFIELTENPYNDELDITIRSTRDPKQETRDLCFDEYVSDLKLCSLSFIGGALSFSTFGPWGAVIGGAVSYGRCAYSAKNAYNRCKR